MMPFLALLIVAVSIGLVARRVELRLVLLGAALGLGSSFGGDLLNPGAQDIQGLSVVAGVAAPALSVRIVPASLAGMLAATVAFSLRHRPPRDRDADAPGDRAGGVVAPGDPI